MADDRKKKRGEEDESGELEGLSDDVREALASDDEARQGLSEEIAQKWDPSRLLRMVSSRAGRGERLDEATRRRYEEKLGVDLGDVRIFTGEFADEVTKAHSAEALTIGGTGMIMMGSTASRSKATASGRALLAHELTHVAQEHRGVHRRAYDGETPLATEEHESEAEAVEAEELESQSGTNRDPNRDQKRSELLQKVFVRLVEVFDEEERVWDMRNGQS